MLGFLHGCWRSELSSLCSHIKKFYQLNYLPGPESGFKDTEFEPAHQLVPPGTITDTCPQPHTHTRKTSILSLLKPSSSVLGGGQACLLSSEIIVWMLRKWNSSTWPYRGHPLISNDALIVSLCAFAGSWRGVLPLSSRKLYLAAGLALGTHSPFKNIPHERDSHQISPPNLRTEVWEGFGSTIWGCLCFVFVILEIKSTNSHILGKSSVIATSLPFPSPFLSLSLFLL